MRTSLDKRRRILLLFLLGIGLPSFLLGYLAFRGVRNDRALLERQTQNERRTVADQIVGAVNENISEVERAFLDAINAHQGDEVGTIATLDSLKNANPLIEDAIGTHRTISQDFRHARLANGIDPAPACHARERVIWRKFL